MAVVRTFFAPLGRRETAAPAGLQAQRSDHPMTPRNDRVKVREEDFRQREAHPVAHHLALRAFAAFEQQRLALA